MQIWGSYLKDTPDENLENWLKNHLGSKFDGKGFDYDDVLADLDAFLLANQGIIDLSENLSKIFRYNKNERIEMFYKERFGSKKENKSKIIVIRFKSKLSIFENKVLVLIFFPKFNFKIKK
ncbi:hypothetical protein [Wansuia hejianensis]|uniref:Uncharacterized protein n=1 Tax=Wansuia hejianensis TaxID=2763667 RepID=A0A926F0Z9_9FIRM|nr:hypothetical protein [Wansuia hejianensis]MBC8589899.1 hypothetical protein [Wansuia hejianensis]